MSSSTNIQRLIDIMARLRDPDSGCPWDLKQDFGSIVKHTIEEAYEVADTIERQALDELPGELGDLLFQVIFYSQLGKEQGRFDFNQVVDTICEKLIRRHPHVFSDTQFANEQEVHANWENEKAREREQLAKARKQLAKARQQLAGEAPVSLLDNLPVTLPALTRADKIQKRVARHGFDWPSWHGCVDKIREEIDEVEAELTAESVCDDRVEDELGDLLFAVVNLVRAQKKDPEQVLRRANNKFERRFRAVERRLAELGTSPEEADLQQMDEIWNALKHRV